MHLWFNRTFSSVYAAIGLIKQADVTNEFTITYSHPNPHAAAQRVADQFLLEPRDLRGEEYVDWCLQTCIDRKVDLFWPGHEARLIAEHKARFEVQGTRVMNVATPEVLRLLNDKAQFCAEVQLSDAFPAEYRVFTCVAEFDAAYAELKVRFPRLCVKPSISVYGLGFGILDEERNAAQLLIAGEQYKVGLQDFRRGLADMGECKPMLLMEYLEGPEYSVDCVGNAGVVVAAVPRKKSPLAGYGQTIECDPVIMQAVRELTRQFQLSGIYNVQFKETQGKPRLLEINARMSGGIAMACQAGPNLPYLAVKGFVDGFDKLEVPAIDQGIRVMEISVPITIASV